jgi:hypothetical protein
MQESSALPAVKGGTPSPGRGACSTAAFGGFLTARIVPSQTHRLMLCRYYARLAMAHRGKYDFARKLPPSLAMPLR